MPYQNQIASIALMVAVPGVTAGQAPVNVETLRFSQPASIAELDADDLKGQPARLAWSPDGSQLYVQFIDGNFGLPPAPQRHYVLDAGTGKRQNVKTEPDWAAAYWTTKSDRTAPDLPAFSIELQSETRVEKTVSAPMGGALARGGTSGDPGTSTGDALAAAYNQAPVPVHIMRLSGETIGEFVNSVIVPGLTFGWGPKGSHLIAYSAKNGRVVVMDDKGKKQDVDGTKDSLLPAWSPDGCRLAWLQKDGKKKYQVRVVRVE
jgi:hypothetical protein